LPVAGQLLAQAAWPVGDDTCVWLDVAKDIPAQMIDDLKEQEGVHGICGLGTCRDRAALIGFATT
jgi:hypothetical protein